MLRYVAAELERIGLPAVWMYEPAHEHAGGLGLGMLGGRRRSRARSVVTGGSATWVVTLRRARLRARALAGCRSSHREPRLQRMGPVPGLFSRIRPSALMRLVKFDEVQTVYRLSNASPLVERRFERDEASLELPLLSGSLARSQEIAAR